MIQFLIRRVFWAFFLFITATGVTYVLFFVIPSDPARIACGKACTGPMKVHIEKMMGLDLPLYQQYWNFVWGLVRHGSFGYSFVNGTPVR